MRDGENLLQICERSRAAHPDIPRLHHVCIEEECIESKTNKPLNSALSETASGKEVDNDVKVKKTGRQTGRQTGKRQKMVTMN